MTLICLCHGSSMHPTFPRLSLIKIKKLELYQIGDIISLKTFDEKFHCHRITELDEQTVSTKGDNLTQQPYEIKVPIKNIEGKATLVFPKKTKVN